MKFAQLALAALALSAAPALANDQVVAGAAVYGPEGNQVGTIVEVEAGQAILDTGKHKVPLGIEMYGEGEKGPTITVTKATLDGMVDQQLAQAAAARDAALIAGANVVTADNQALGSILKINGNNVIIARGGDEANKVTLLRDHFSATNGILTARLTMAQIDQAMAGMAASASAAAEAEAAPTEAAQ